MRRTTRMEVRNRGSVQEVHHHHYHPEKEKEKKWFFQKWPFKLALFLGVCLFLAIFFGTDTFLSTRKSIANLGSVLILAGAVIAAATFMLTRNPFNRFALTMIGFGFLLAVMGYSVNQLTTTGGYRISNKPAYRTSDEPGYGLRQTPGKQRVITREEAEKDAPVIYDVPLTPPQN